MLSLPESVSSLVVATLFAGGILAAFFSARSALDSVWDKLNPDWKDRVTQVIRYVFGERITPADALAMVIFAECSLAGLLFWWGLSAVAILIAVGLAVAFPVFMYRRASVKRGHELELALPMALQQVANEMAAGATLETALKKVAKTAPAPADVEIARLQRRVEIKGVDAAFTEMAARLYSRSFALTAAVVRVGTSSGGQLVAALKNLSRTLIEIERLNRKLRTASENGRRNLYLMSLIGPLVAIGSGMAVDHEHSVMEDSFGQFLIGISVLSFFAAHVIGFALTKVKV